MGAVAGALLPLAVGIAISPIPIIAIILMLLAPRAGGASAGFGLGWLLGIATATTIVLLVASGAGTSTGEPSVIASLVTLLVGVLLLGIGVRQWRERPKPGDDAPMPKWMATIDRVTPVRAAGLGIALAAVNPKNLLMCIAAGVTIAGAGLTAGEAATALAVFTLIAASTVLALVLAYASAGDRLQRPLDQLKRWLQANSTAVMSILFLVIGVVLLGRGLRVLL